MKKNYFFILLIILSSNVLSQNYEKSEKLNETDSIYLKAVKEYIIEIDSFYNKYSKEDQPKKLFIQKEKYLSKLPKKVSEYEIFQIDTKSKSDYLNLKMNKFFLVEITPIRIQKERVFIVLTPWHASVDIDNELFLELSDWTIVEFKFIDGILKHYNTESNGI